MAASSGELSGLGWRLPGTPLAPSADTQIWRCAMQAPPVPRRRQTAEQGAAAPAIRLTLQPNSMVGYAELRGLREAARQLRQQGISMTVDSGDPADQRLLSLVGLSARERTF